MEDRDQHRDDAPADTDGGRSGGYVGGLILTGFFFLLVAALAVGALAAVGFAAVAMPVTTSLVLLFFLVAAIAAWRARLRHERARRRARAEFERGG
jgi:membrane protein implicated in regulation of membrane protease activity